MGASQFHGIIVIVTFLAVVLIIMGVAASQTPTFFAATTPNAPDASGKTNPSNYLSWNVTNAVQLNTSDPHVYYDVPDWRGTYWVDATGVSGRPAIYVQTYGYFWLFKTDFQELFWYNETTGDRVSEDLNGIEGMPIENLEAVYDSSINYNYRLTNSKGSLHISINWNFTAYGGNITAALSGQGIFFSLKQDFSDRQTTINLMDILTGLFLGSLFGSNTLGIDPTISAIITIALDSAMVYLAYSIVRGMIPFLPGGGD